MNTTLFVLSIAITLLIIFSILAMVYVTSAKKRKSKYKIGTTSTLADTLRDERLKSSIILNAIDDGVMLIDSQRLIQLFNPGASKLTGWPVEETLGLDCNSVIRLVDNKDNTYSDNDNPFSRVLRSGTTIRDNRAILATRANKRIAISLSVTPLLDENKNFTGAVAIFRDVSQERAEEQQRTEFISTASHEMRTPIAAIEGYLALALNNKVSTIDKRASEYLTKAHVSTQHLGQLFQDLLTSAKAEDGRLSDHPSVIEMAALLAQLTEDLRFVAENKGLFTEFTLGSNIAIDANSVAGEKVIKPLYYVYADPGRIREVFTNLFDNACKYTEQGKITVGLTGDNSVVQFFIRDTGSGISAEDIPHLFQKFYRIDNSATRTVGGTGLGLFICRKIVELYNGHIWVESELEKGSTFFINLPRLNTQQAEQLQATKATQISRTVISPTAS